MIKTQIPTITEDFNEKAKDIISKNKNKFIRDICKYGEFQIDKILLLLNKYPRQVRRRVLFVLKCINDELDLLEEFNTPNEKDIFKDKLEKLFFWNISYYFDMKQLSKLSKILKL